MYNNLYKNIFLKLLSSVKIEVIKTQNPKNVPTDITAGERLVSIIIGIKKTPKDINGRFLLNPEIIFFLPNK
ncbi:hypothetical protein H477_1329 [[Clostridium] sordellii ATCC 9714]|uniref:hypothetical protein n=1 Tax=Paraclostridium sordellii TaxID=1505 RepID=UPI0003863E8C|nr:hypothetical protein [Paeniclostridium sordellii]EPZ58576.1 hypothetical protein H477_1329 [[Clostridium] sordellii ATCC 9714] [Paeniclostridium sordellii ATCC 9714]